MSAVITSRHFASIEDYLATERGGECRHEYIDGQVYAMTRASRAHGLIVNAIAYALTPTARHKHCQLFTSDMKIHVDIGGSTAFYYPDVLLSCDATDIDPYFSHAPCLIIEVLSPSTVRIDRREKLLAYRTLPSLQSYLLVEQSTRAVELYCRAHDWTAEYFGGGEVPLTCLDTYLKIDDIYVDVPETTGTAGS